MTHTITALLLAAALAASCTACTGTGQGTAGGDETLIALSDSGVQVDGEAAPTDAGSAVYVGGEIIYYEDGTDETYGEGSEAEKHSAQEAAAHTVVTITQPGTYRVSGALSQGQLLIDLGEGAQEDPEAVVTLILDGVELTCTVAPAVFFYRVYECGSKEEADAGPVVDTSAAGANVILAAGSENVISGSHVARIYQEGTTDKLHKYDGAFYSKMSMNVDGEDGDDSGVLRITADNEGLDSELHLTINGGTISIQAQDDGINANEDGISVITLNGGSLTVEGGLGAEGDGIDSNGYLTINGGTLWTVSNESSPDGGIDADEAITINGGLVYAFGTRNDAVDGSSAQPYLELSFASTLAAGTVLTVTDEEGETLFEAACPKTCQSVTLSSALLALDTTYYVYADGVQQCYTGNMAGMGGGFGGGRPGGGTPPEGDAGGMDGRPGGGGLGQDAVPPEGSDPGQTPPGDREPGQMEQPPEGGRPPEDGGAGRTQGPDGQTPGGTEASDGETAFILTQGVKSFSGVCDAADSGKTRVTFTVEGLGMDSLEISAVRASEEGLADDQIQITVTDSPSEDYAESCLLSDGLEAVNALLPDEAGGYVLTVAVVSGNEVYTGAVQIPFTVGERETDAPA